MPVVTLRNKSDGPRFVNLVGGEQRVLMPNEVATVDMIGEDPSKDLMVVAGQFEIMGEGAKAQSAAMVEGGPAGFDAEEYARKSEDLVRLREEVRVLEEQRQALELDQARLTPPRQLAGDGGPDQMVTTGGTPGAPTPKQGEGTAEQRNRGMVATGGEPPEDVADAVKNLDEREQKAQEVRQQENQRVAEAAEKGDQPKPNRGTAAAPAQPKK